jgi:lysophospholipase L1-like esterase
MIRTKASSQQKLVGRLGKLHEWWFWMVGHRFLWRIGQMQGRVHGRGPLLVVMGDSLTDPFIGFTYPRQNWLRYVGRHGYKTVNLGNGSDRTIDMATRVDEFFSEGRPDVAVLFAGNVDAETGIDHFETERNVTYIMDWLRERAVDKIVLMGPGMTNLPKAPAYMPPGTDWAALTEPVRATFREIAIEHDAVFVDVAQFLLDRIARGQDPDFSRVPYRQWRSWHKVVGDGHLNAYGNRLVAEAFLVATSGWRPAPDRSCSLRPILGRRWRARAAGRLEADARPGASSRKIEDRCGV